MLIILEHRVRETFGQDWTGEMIVLCSTNMLTGWRRMTLISKTGMFATPVQHMVMSRKSSSVGVEGLYQAECVQGTQTKSQLIRRRVRGGPSFGILHVSKCSNGTPF